MIQTAINAFISNLVLYVVTILLAMAGVSILFRLFPGIFNRLKDFSFTKAKIIVLVLILLYIIFFSIYAMVRYELFAPAVYDIGNMSQALYNTLNGDLLRMTTYYPAETRLFFHVEPIMFFISLFYKLWQDPRIILIIQTLILGIGALPVFLIAYKKLKNTLVSVFFAFVYLLNPSIHQANIFDFHPLALSVTFILFAFYFLIRDKYKISFLFFVVAMLCREEIGIMVFLFGLYTVFFRDKKWGMAISLIGLTWSLVALFVIIPYFSPADSPLQFSLYERFGENPQEIIKYIITHPFSIFEYFGGLGKLNYIMFLFTPFVFISFFSPIILITGILPFFTVFLSDSPYMLLGMFQYNAPLVAPLILASIFGVFWLARRLKKYKAEKVILFVTSIIVLTNVLLLVFHQWTPLSFKNPIQTIYYSEKIKAAKEAIKLIPKKASVVASWRLAPRVANRRDLYLINTPFRNTADYIFVNSRPDVLCQEDDWLVRSAKKNEDYPLKFCEATLEEYQVYLEEIKNNFRYILIFEKEEILLFKKI